MLLEQKISGLRTLGANTSSGNGAIQEYHHFQGNSQCKTWLADNKTTRFCPPHTRSFFVGSPDANPAHPYRDTPHHIKVPGLSGGIFFWGQPRPHDTGVWLVEAAPNTHLKIHTAALTRIVGSKLAVSPYADPDGQIHGRTLGELEIDRPISGHIPPYTAAFASEILTGGPRIFQVGQSSETSMSLYVHLEIIPPEITTAPTIGMDALTNEQIEAARQRR